MKAIEFAGLVPESCAEVLDTMYFTSVFGATQEMTVSPLTGGDVAFSLHFSGKVSGDFGLRVNAETAETLAANFLGDEAGESGVKETIGELANMLCGSVVSRVDATRKFVLSHPQPVVSLPEGEREDLLVTRLETDSGVLTTWIVVSGSEGTRR